MKNLLLNWRTTAAGVLLIVLAVLSMAGVAIPGFTMPAGGIGTAIVMGVGLILSGDASLSAKFNSVIGGLGIGGQK